jgi:4-amino-4-deoxy-L-arabinose transferase-like glycosyltransferase
MGNSKAAESIHSHRWLALWLLIALAARLAWATHLPTSNAAIDALPDQREYLQLGRNLLEHHALFFHDDRFHADVWAYRTPGYPAFVALCGGSIQIIRMLQAVLDASSVLAVYLLASRWLGPRRSLLAAAIVAINPWLIYFTGLILAETLFTSLMIWGMVLLSCQETGRWINRRSAIVGAALLAIAVMVRPSGLLLPLLLAAVNLQQNISYQWRRPLIAAVMLVVLLFPWALRNNARVGYVWTTTNSGITLYDGFNPAADGSSNQSFLKQMPELQEMGELQRSQYLAAKAREFIHERPAAVVHLTLSKLLRMWSPIPMSREYGSHWRYVAAGVLYTLPFFLLSLIGLGTTVLPPRVKLFLILPAVYFTIVHAASVGSIRYRIPADVPMAVIAAAAASRPLKNAHVVDPDS